MLEVLKRESCYCQFSKWILARLKALGPWVHITVEGGALVLGHAGWELASNSLHIPKKGILAEKRDPQVRAQEKASLHEQKSYIS